MGEFPNELWDLRQLESPLGWIQAISVIPEPPTIRLVGRIIESIYQEMYRIAPSDSGGSEEDEVTPPPPTPHNVRVNRNPPTPSSTAPANAPPAPPLPAAQIQRPKPKTVVEVLVPSQHRPPASKPTTPAATPSQSKPPTSKPTAAATSGDEWVLANPKVHSPALPSTHPI